MPKADAILVTHEHGDHFDPTTIEKIRKANTVVLGNAAAVQKAGFGETLEPGTDKKVLDITVTAVPAYNLTPDRLKFHPRAQQSNGYVLTFADKRVYVAGDTEATPEMKALQGIDIAFLPIALPYTMSPAETAAAARAFKPKILYPYHQGQFDPHEVKRLLADERTIEVRVLPLP
jgi:L-ascorbate metabolism protein UlaG (beta-lactamase superfamily)